MLSFGNTICAAQISAGPNLHLCFYKKLNTYVSLMVPAVKQVEEFHNESTLYHNIFISFVEWEI